MQSKNTSCSTRILITKKGVYMFTREKNRWKNIIIIYDLLICGYTTVHSLINKRMWNNEMKANCRYSIISQDPPKNY
jgi:hypothetical protein